MLALALLGSQTTSAQARPAAGGEARDVAADRAGKLEERVRRHFLAREIERLSREANAPFPKERSVVVRALNLSDRKGVTATQKLADLVDLWSKKLAGDAGDEAKRAATLRDAWLEVHAELNDRASRIADAEATTVPDVAVAAPWSALAVAPLGLLAIVAFDRRRRSRRTLDRLGWPRALLWVPAILLIGAVADWALRPAAQAKAYRLPRPPTRDAPDALDAIEAKIAAMAPDEDGLDPKYQDAASRWKDSLSNAIEPGNPLLVRWLSARRSLSDLHAALFVQELWIQAIQKDAAALKDRAAELASRDKNAQGSTARGSTLFALAGIAAPLASLAFLGFLWAGERRRRRIDADTCARCLTVGSFEVEEAPDDAGRLRCNAIWSAGEPCGFRFSEQIRNRPRLCFPTMGITQAGKTYWMAALVGELKHAGDQAVRFEEVETQGLLHVRKILEQIRAGFGYQHSFAVLPDPVIYDFADADFPAWSEALLNLFDYAGEVAQSLDPGHPLRRRMMQGDGYFAFLDPTNDPELQQEIYQGIYRDHWNAGRVSHGHPVDIPAAICVTKIDALRHNLDGAKHEAAVTKFYEGLRKIEADRRGGEITLALIKARSRVTARFLRELWPHIDVEERFRRLFGRRYRFFPMTPYGLERRDDTPVTAGATAEPFGVREPLIWMLHVNGFRVFRWPPLARLARLP